MFTNTILNIVYMRILEDQYDELFKIRPVVYAYNHGDDVFSEVLNRTDGVMLTHTARLMGLAGNINKIARRFGEYLRIRYDTDGVGGHLLRSLSNIITRDWQASEDHRPEERVTASTVQFRKAISRGARADVMEKLWQTQLDFYRRVVVTDSWFSNQQWHRRKREAMIPREYFIGSVIERGSGCGTPISPPKRLKVMLPKHITPSHVPKSVRKQYGDEMTSDFWRHAHEKFPMMRELEYWELAQIVHTMQADNIMGSLPPFAKAIMKRRYADDIKRYIIRNNRIAKNNSEREETFGQLEIHMMNMAVHDVHEMVRHWLDYEYKLWNYSLNPMLAMERAVAKLPSKRKDLLRLWATAFARHYQVSMYSALTHVGVMVSSTGEMSQWLLNIAGFVSEKMAVRMAFGLVPFDNILGGRVCTELEQLFRNNAVWRAFEHLLNTGHIIDKELSLQQGVRAYELTVNRLLANEFREFSSKYWRA